MSTFFKASNQERFKAHLQKIGGGQHTGQGLSREESAEALDLILKSQASPAQIGAFMIAHRIRRPEPQELAGMLDTYYKLGPQLKSAEKQKRPICFGMPFDGRNRTAPIYPLTALILLNAGQPVVLQGGRRMPTKYGVTTEELFNALGLNLQGLTINEVQTGFNLHGFALIHQPDHFPLAENLINYRDEIGKRPPLASMELLWTAHQGNHLIISGFVHPPTEKIGWKTLSMLGEKELITVKGLEGSTDLPINRPCITGHVKNATSKRLTLKPHKYELFEKEVKWESIEKWKAQAQEAMENRGPLIQSLIWNSGVYLWFSGSTETLHEGIKKAINLIEKGQIKSQLEKLIYWNRNRN